MMEEFKAFMENPEKGGFSLDGVPFKELKEGEIVHGRVIDIIEGKAVVDIGYKAEGMISLSEFKEPAAVKIGDEGDFFLDLIEDEDGMVVLSKNKADKLLGWERVVNNYNEGDIIVGSVSRKVKGGFMVDIGIEAFLPTSLSSLKGYPPLSEDPSVTVKFIIVKVNKARKNIVVSRKDYLLREREAARGELAEKLNKGVMIKGRVKNITDFGAFIDLGGIDGLLHITDMSWGRISHPSELVALNDEVEVMVLDFDRERMRVSLGLKQKTPNPWLDVDNKYPVGSRIKGTVVNVVPYGAFVELEKGIEGLVHISEFSWVKRYSHPSELLAIGDIIETVVLDIDKDNHKISLGIKQLEQDPWQGVEERYSSGARVEGKVKNLTDYGAFVELEDGIDGLVHISDISWTRKINHPKEVFKKGQRIEAAILNVDQANRKISLGVKQLIPDPWQQIVDRYRPDTEIQGPVTKVTNFGLFVELEKDLEGLIHASEINLPEGEKVEHLFKEGYVVQAKVLKVDSGAKKIALSMKDYEIPEELLKAKTSEPPAPEQTAAE